MIELYIDNQLVDINDKISINLTKQISDVQEPGKIKNSFSQTINIIGTPTNNKIFGNIYDLSRITRLTGTTSQTGIDFNATKRTPMQLFKNSQLKFEGYMKLNSIDYNESVEELVYNITIFDVIGDWFNYLNETYLTDLDLNILTHKIDRTTLAEFFSNHPTGTNETIYDYMTYLMAYNGQYTDFNSKTGCFNYLSGGAKFDSIGNIAEFKKIGVSEVDEFQWTIGQRDRLMSYKQRPAVYINKIINKILQTIPTGYTLDTNFLTSGNTLYQDVIYTLPFLKDAKSTVSGVTETFRSYGGSTSSYYYQSYEFISDHPNQYNTDVSLLPRINTSPQMNAYYATLSSKDGLFYQTDGIQLFFLNGNANKINFNFSIPFSIKFRTRGRANQDTLYNGYATWDVPIEFLCRWNIDGTTVNLKGLQTKIYDYRTADGDMAKESYKYTLHFSNNIVPDIEEIKYKDADDNVSVKQYFYGVDNGSNISQGTVTYAYKPIIQMMIPEIKVAGQSTHWNGYQNGKLTMWSYAVSEGFDNLSVFVDGSTETKTLSGSQVTKNEMLPRISLLDFLLSYTKLFDLRFNIDYINKNIQIVTRDLFFKDEVIKDLTEQVDRKKGLTIKPITFDKKYLVLNYLAKNDSNTYLKLYSDYYGKNYAEKILDTGFEFDTGSKKVFEKITINPPVLVQELLPVGKTKLTDSRYQDPGKDNKTLLACFKRDGNTRKSDDTYGHLLFNRKTDRIRTYTVGGYYITDLTKMSKNANNYCWNMTDYDLVGQRFVGGVFKEGISDLYTTYPFYSVVDETKQYSLDLYRPNEVYNDEDYPEGIDIYSRFWDKYLSDRYNVDSKIVEVDIFLNEYEKENIKLSDFIMIDNILYSINKITNLNMCEDIQAVTFELITVKDITNYTTL